MGMLETAERQGSTGTRVELANLVFLCGVASGGTDLLQSVVNAHGRIFMPGEFPFLGVAAERFGASVPAEQRDALIAELRRLDAYNNFVHHHYENFASDRRDPVQLPPAPRPVDGEVTATAIYQWLLGVPGHILWTGNKTPTNTENLDKLHRLFPNARFIIIVRDPRDVALSWRRKWGKHELLAAAKWERRLARGRELAATLPEHATLWIRFEDLIDDLEGTSRRICEFLELPFDPAMLEFHQHLGKQIPGKPNWGKPLVKGNYGKWRKELSPRKARRVEEIARPGMVAHGYEPEVSQRARRITRLERWCGTVNDVYASLFVGNRYYEGRKFVARLRDLAFDVQKLLFRRSIRY